MKRKKARKQKENRPTAEIQSVVSDRRSSVLAVAVIMPGQPVRLAFDEKEFFRLGRK